MLRIVVGGAASIQGAVFLMRTPAPNGVIWIAAALAVVSGFALVAGVLTPGSAAVAGLTTLFIATWTQPNAPLAIDHLAAVIVAGDAAALALLGPGALSMDARLFGRRELIIPHDPRTQQRRASM